VADKFSTFAKPGSEIRRLDAAGHSRSDLRRNSSSGPLRRS
jgi:hypothetical protein